MDEELDEELDRGGRLDDGIRFASDEDVDDDEVDDEEDDDIWRMDDRRGY